METTTNVTSASNGGMIGGLNAAKMGRDEFLKLLVTQLQHQDPLSPMESQDFAAQLAQFSQLEQLTGMSEMMEESMNVDLMLTQAINNTMATAFMGKTVTAVGAKVTFNGSAPVELNFKLMGQAEDVTVKVVDSSGNSIKEFKMGALTGGTHRVDWNGFNKHGEKLNSGNYKFEVVAKDAKNAPVSGVTLIKGVINGVRYENGNAVFLVNDSEIQFNKVMDIMTTEEVSDS